MATLPAGKLMVKNWNKYQHYKDRKPPWIKLATDTFQDYEFSKLQDASKLLAIAVWTIASCTNDGSIPNDFEFIKSQCFLGKCVKSKHFNELISSGFLVVASTALAECKQSAMPETETETETEESRGREETKVQQQPGISSIEAARAVLVEARMAGDKNLAMIRMVIENELALHPTWEPKAIAESLIETRRNYEGLLQVRSPAPGFFIWPTPAFFSSGIWRQPEIWLNGDKSGEAKLGSR